MFSDRRDAGRQLARLLTPGLKTRGSIEPETRGSTIILALPRGGVPVAAEIASALRVPFDVFLVRKLGVPTHQELAMGAIAEGGIRVLNHDLVRELQISAAEIDAAAAREGLELNRRARAFRGGRPMPHIAGRTIILVDDGLATGASMEAAVMAVRAQHPAKIVVAVPVAARETGQRFTQLADEFVAVAMPEPFQAVGLWYDDFAQLTDEDVVAMLPVS